MHLLSCGSAHAITNEGGPQKAMVIAHAWPVAKTGWRKAHLNPSPHELLQHMAAWASRMTASEHPDRGDRPLTSRKHGRSISCCRGASRVVVRLPKSFPICLRSVPVRSSIEGQSTVSSETSLILLYYLIRLRKGYSNGSMITELETSTSLIVCWH